MKFNQHYDLYNAHSFLSPSKHHWINYSDEKLISTYTKFQATQRGTRLHELASECIKLKVKLPRTKVALNMFVNDAIGLRMESEQPLYYSENAFGTADAISFKNNFLRIHDLKTGVTRVSMDQLQIYAAFFCLEYGVYPEDISIELRIYQGDEVIMYEPNPNDIKTIMDTVVRFDKEINIIKEQME